MESVDEVPDVQSIARRNEKVGIDTPNSMDLAAIGLCCQYNFEHSHVHHHDRSTPSVQKTVVCDFVEFMAETAYFWFIDDPLRSEVQQTYGVHLAANQDALAVEPADCLDWGTKLQIVNLLYVLL